MQKLLEFLIVQLKTVDGLRDSGKAVIKAQMELKRQQEEEQLKKDMKKGKSAKLKELPVTKMTSAEFIS